MDLPIYFISDVHLMLNQSSEEEAKRESLYRFLNFVRTTRGTLFFDIARILDYKKPKAFLLENVKGLRGHDKGKTFKTIIATLNELGYETLESKVLNAKRETNHHIAKVFP